MAQNGLTALVDLDAKEISLVNEGANRKKRFPIFKQETEMNEEFQEILKAVFETEVDNEDALFEGIEKKALSEKGMNAAKAALRVMSAFKEEMPEDLMERLGKLAGMKQKEPEKYPPPDKKQKKPEEDMDTKKQVKKEAGDLPDEIQAIMKAQQEEIAKAKAEADDAKAKVVEIAKASRRRELISKCKEEYSHVPGLTAEQMAEMIMKAEATDEKFAEQLEKGWKETSEAVRKSELLASSGANAANMTCDAWQKIETLAEGIVQKSSDASITKAKAISLVLETQQGKDLYADYLAENPKQLGI